jgi:hypothetical protein
VPKAHPIWTKEWICTATLNVANGSHGNTFIFIDKETFRFSFRRHILYNRINLLVVPKPRPLWTKFQKSSCQRHENSIVGMDSMATHCRKLIVTGIYQANSYQKFVMSYWLAFVPKALNILSILICNNYVLAIGLFRAFPSFRQAKLFRLMELSHLILKYEEKSLVK